MKKKEFIITDRQLEIIREKAIELGISQNESLRRLLDKVIDQEYVRIEATPSNII